MDMVISFPHMSRTLGAVSRFDTGTSNPRAETRIVAQPYRRQPGRAKNRAGAA
jgi:hypothetical protein